MEIKLTSDMFEQGKLDPDASVGSDYAACKDSSTHSLHEKRVRSKDLIPCGSDRKITFSGDNSHLMIWILEFDKDKKYLGIGKGWNYFTTYTLKFETAYVAFMIARNPKSAYLDVSLLDTLSLIPYHDDWMSIKVDMYRGQCSTWATKPYSDWGIKAGDVVTFQIRIKSTSGKKLRARIEWFNSDNDRVSTYPDTVQIISNGEGISTITHTVPSGYSQMGLWLDANLTVSTHTATTQELVKADIFVIGSSIPQNLDRRGVLVMSNYPDLPIITTPDGFEYAEGFNMFMCGSLTSENMAYWSKPAGYSLSLENGYYIVRLASDCDSAGGIAFSGGGYSNKAIVVPGTSYVWGFDCFPDVVCPFNHESIGHTQCREIGNESNLHVETTRRCTPTTIPANVWTHCEVEFTVSKPSYFFPYLWHLGYISGMKGKAIRFKNFMLQIGTKQHPYRPNPADLVGGGCL